VAGEPWGDIDSADSVPALSWLAGDSKRILTGDSEAAFFSGNEGYALRSASLTHHFRALRGRLSPAERSDMLRDARRRDGKFRTHLQSRFAGLFALIA
jgi:hypothetical protein